MVQCLVFGAAQTQHQSCLKRDCLRSSTVPWTFCQTVGSLLFSETLISYCRPITLWVLSCSKSPIIPPNTQKQTHCQSFFTLVNTDTDFHTPFPNLLRVADKCPSPMQSERNIACQLIQAFPDTCSHPWQRWAQLPCSMATKRGPRRYWIHQVQGLSPSGWASHRI